MFNKIFESISNDIDPYGHFSTIIENLGKIIDYFDQDYMKDKSARNAALDALCEFLQKQKEQ
jgi:hypothetical protein